ncbi:4'-phosphopantetheinyl transferase superfamily protein [Bacillus timonensis]|nr:4'-phosphopantetheinyl transferase superfamily protein [Bacillus timonensis]
MKWEQVDDISNMTNRKAFLTGNEVHVWQTATNLPNYESLSCFLTLDERKNAEMFRFERDRRCYVVTHSALRLLLSAYLKCPPHTVLLKRGVHGKPFVVGSPLQFNLSHSKDVACFVFSTGAQVGVDVEYVMKEFQWESVATYYFSEEERRKLASQTEGQVETFFQVWTEKEAVGKGEGFGLLHSGPSTLTTNTFTVGESYVGTVAFSPAVTKVNYYHFGFYQ